MSVTRAIGDLWIIRAWMQAPWKLSVVWITRIYRLWYNFIWRISFYEWFVWWEIIWSCSWALWASNGARCILSLIRNANTHCTSCLGSWFHSCYSFSSSLLASAPSLLVSFPLSLFLFHLHVDTRLGHVVEIFAQTTSPPFFFSVLQMRTLAATPIGLSWLRTEPLRWLTNIRTERYSPYYSLHDLRRL